MANEPPLSPFTRQRIARLAEAALRDAGVVGEHPTPIAAVLQQLGVRDRLDISRLPPELEPASRRAGSEYWVRCC